MKISRDSAPSPVPAAVPSPAPVRVPASPVVPVVSETKPSEVPQGSPAMDTTQIQQLKQQIVDQEKQLLSQKDSISKHQATIAQLQKGLLESEAREQETTKQLTEARQLQEQSSSELQADLVKQRERVSQLEQRTKQFSVSIYIIEHSLSVTDREVLYKQVDELSKAAASLTEANKSLRNELLIAQDENNTLKAQVFRLEGKVVGTMGMVQSTRSQKDLARDKVGKIF